MIHLVRQFDGMMARSIFKNVRSYFWLFAILNLLASVSVACSCGNDHREAQNSTDTIVQPTNGPAAQEPMARFQVEDTSQSVELPALKPGQKVINKSGYSLVYSEAHEQALWVAYELTASETQSAYARTDRFLSDPEVATGSARPTDYKGTGYDRGHLAPAGDLGWSAQSMTESFYMSNMSPQTPGFNRGIWKRLEELVRTWAVEYGAVCVVTAGILTNDLPSIGSTGVSVPSYYYKVILDHTGPDYKAIGFILPNASSKASLQAYAVSVDEVERVTGINFFSALDDTMEESLEARFSTAQWTWRASQGSREPGSNQNAVESVQCQGTTKKGLRCRNRTLDPSGYCHHHR